METAQIRCKALLGKNVSCFSRAMKMAHGRNISWRLPGMLGLKENMPVEQAAALCVNPFTAYAL